MTMDVITRKQAQSLGLKRFFTGEACLHGHVAERFVSSKGCVDCTMARKNVWQAANPEKVAEMRRNWAAENPERNKAVKAAWNKANPEGQAKRSREWFLANKKKAQASSAEWKRRNPGNVLAHATRRRLAVIRRAPAWADTNCINAIYKLAKIYRKFGHDVHVDHDIPIRGKLVCGLHVHQNLNIIPALVNLSKTNSFIPS